MSEYYNLKQAELVRKCEEPYKVGLKEKTSSGKTTENLLITFLQEEFKGKLFFKRIKTCKIDLIEEFMKNSKKNINEKLSPQTDIVGVRKLENIWIREDGLEVIPYNKVKFVIEVKKKDTIETNQITRLTNFYDSIPIFFISFRGTGSKKPVLETLFAKTILETIGDNNIIEIFMLSWQNSRESKEIRKKLMAGASETIRIEGFEGELERVIAKINEIIR